MKIITKKGSKITEKGNESYEDEFPDRETSYPIGTVFLTVNVSIIFSLFIEVAAVVILLVSQRSKVKAFRL